VTGTPGSDGLGEIKAGFLEDSNVNKEEEIRISEESDVYESHVQKALDIVCLQQSIVNIEDPDSSGIN